MLYLIDVAHDTACLVDEETSRKISTGLLVLKDSELVWPDIRYIPNKGMEKQYKKNKKDSEKLDKKFAKAYEKALKKVQK